MVTFLIPTAETPGLYSITLSTKRNGNLHANITNSNKTQLRNQRMNQDFCPKKTKKKSKVKKDSALGRRKKGTKVNPTTKKNNTQISNQMMHKEADNFLNFKRKTKHKPMWQNVTNLIDINNSWKGREP